MWGSSFADLAKQAADLQEQAAKTAAQFQEQAASVVENVPSANSSSFASPVGFASAGGFFNMDSLQEGEGDPKMTQVQKEPPKPEPVPAPVVERKPEEPPKEEPDEEEDYVQINDAEEQGDDNEEGEDDKEALERAWKERQEQKKRDKEMAQAAAAPEIILQQQQPVQETGPDKVSEEEGDNDEDGEVDGGFGGEDGWSDDIGNVDTEDSAEEEEKPVEVTPPATQPVSVPQPVRMDHDDSKKEASASEGSNADKTQSTTSQEPAPSPSVIPDHVLNQFSEQLKRLEENHAAEKQATQVRYEQEMQGLKQELVQAQQGLRQEKVDAKRAKEGQSLKLDALKRELTGTQELLQDKEKEFKRLQQQHLKQLRDMEKQMVKAEDNSQGNVEKVRSMEKQVEEANAALEASKEEYDTLKERTKLVASELKERRAECRTLNAEVEVLKANNTSLQDQITQMQGESLDMNQNSKEKQLELHTLRTQLAEKEAELTEAQKSIEKAVEKGEEALSTYKKKAQQSLALANGRTASAVQAREEAEMEARAARSTADSSMERALLAEQNGKEAEVKAKLYVSKMEKEVSQFNEVKEALEKITGELEQAKKDAEGLSETNAKQTCELQSIAGRLEASQKTTEDRNKELAESEKRSGELFEETERLNREIHRLKDELHLMALRKKNNDAEEKKDALEQARQVALNSEAEATINMLRQELDDANKAIKELKETLRATVEEAEAVKTGAPAGSAPMQPSAASNEDNAGGMPLFYAMEKQAELTQARNEITRLANLLGDSEADKQHAMENMKDMQRRMNEALAKLKRQEQHEKFTPQEEQVNMEYLKNVTLSFVNAKSVTEKKALLPVIGTVLCLTPEELNKAMAALDSGASTMESVTSSVLSLGWGS